ncbi:threonine/serine ThrE exporter family protein [uncultured Sunxiuqinia sp.]|uniref:threonine/serine ThrE exporter family protein n=1 Tax=Sunxiuqinia rutila TaxID=1397841 RepID=UPI002613E413|nr:threonine/serine exporter family protein [uncultured Sunxiuqinia sp.]
MSTKQDMINKLCKLLLEIGALQMSSGANTSRIRMTVMRIANSYGYNAELLITHRALMLTLYDEEKDYFFSRLKRTSPHGANFRIVSGISRMSWQIVDEKWDLDHIQQEVDRLKALPHYPRLVILLMVGLAGASFCRLFGGSFIDMLITFSATFAGLFVRQEAVKKGFNPYLCIFFGALVSSLIAGASVKLQLGTHPDFAFATSVLYLIPGIPLINSLSDLLDGNLMNGIVRGMFGLIIAFAIAIGLLCAILIYNI